ncbi:MAG: hypothetical protein LHW64_10690 [Candidatus Cloacimonetes bacterium]|nr:hypothetical protein [Candidatus Cloacimonadota bacterium]MDY0230572.1 hypothetical protein [Candidatus Cloacimonadaceae bacterium]
MNNLPQAKPARPTFLTVLCILTFIWSGLSLVLFLLAALLFGVFAEVLTSVPGMGGLISGGVILFVILFVLSLTSLFGAIKMWGLKKLGFYLYTIAQVLMIIVPFIFIPGAEVGVLGIVITAGFILMYGLNLKFMK